MNIAKVKAGLVISAKSAVNAVLVTAPTLKIAPGSFHFHNWSGIDHILEMLGSAVVAREVAIWLPKLLAWSNSPTPETLNGNGKDAKQP